MFTKQCLSIADAQKLLAACKAEAEKNSWNVTIAICDDAGYTMLVERADGAPMPSATIAIAKAKASALAKAPTKKLEDMVKERPAVIAFPDRLPVQGGLPIIFDGQCLGGIGVSGVKSHEDEVIAQAGCDIVSSL